MQGLTNPSHSHWPLPHPAVKRPTAINLSSQRACTRRRAERDTPEHTLCLGQVRLLVAEDSPRYSG